MDPEVNKLDQRELGPSTGRIKRLMKIKDINGKNIIAQTKASFILELPQDFIRHVLSSSRNHHTKGSIFTGI